MFNLFINIFIAFLRLNYVVHKDINTCFIHEAIISSKSQFDGNLHRQILQSNFTGTVLIARGGEILHRQDYGDAAMQNSNEELTYRWASISKTITAIAVLQLAEEKKIDLDHPITEYLEEYKNAEKYPGLKNVTIRELLSHTSRVPDHTDYLEKLAEWRQISSPVEQEYFLKKQEPKEMAENIVSLPLLEEANDYNNFAFTLLGLLVEKKGQSYQDYVQKNIFDKASMATAQIATSRENDLPTAESFALVDDPMVRFASGNINGSIIDLYNLDRALKEGRLLGEKMLKQMQEERLGFDPIILAHPEIAGKTMLAKTGALAGARTLYQYFPEEDLTIIILGNSELDVCLIGENLAQTILS